MLDTRALFMHDTLSLTFIEPYPNRLFGLLTEEDRKQNDILVMNLQEIELEVFDKLESGDILFIDSTHLSKTGSDVNCILFDILPRLKVGVVVHFHDILYPFEYPKEWVYQGRNWERGLPAPRFFDV